MVGLEGVDVIKGWDMFPSGYQIFFNKPILFCLFVYVLEWGDDLI